MSRDIIATGDQAIQNILTVDREIRLDMEQHANAEAAQREAHRVEHAQQRRRRRTNEESDTQTQLRNAKARIAELERRAECLQSIAVDVLLTRGAMTKTGQELRARWFGEGQPARDAEYQELLKAHTDDMKGRASSIDSALDIIERAEAAWNHPRSELPIYRRSTSPRGESAS